MGIAATLHEARIARLETVRAEQEKNARERHFANVRRFANSFMFEVHDAIKDLPGSTSARRLLVANGLQYLDGLSREAGTDRELKQELATAYGKVGDVQGGYNSASQGDRTGALKSYRKALEIRLALAESAPNDADQLRSLFRAHGQYGELLLVTGDGVGAVEQARIMLAIATRLSEMNPKAESDRHTLAKAYIEYGWRQALAGERQEGLANCRKSIVLQEALVAEKAGAKDLRRVLAISYGRVGAIHGDDLENHSEAYGMHKKAEALAESLLASDPTNRDLRNIALNARLGVGHAMSLAGRDAEALVIFRGALREAEEMSTADPADIHMRTMVASLLDYIGFELLDLRNATDAVPQLRRAVAIMEALPAARAGDVSEPELLANSLYLLGRAESQFASDMRLGRSIRRVHWLEARAYFERSRALFLDLRQRQVWRPKRLPDADDAARELAEIAAEIVKLDGRIGLAKAR